MDGHKRRYGVTWALAMAMAANLLFPRPVGAAEDFSMLIMDAFTITDRGTVLTGQIKSGSVSVGDTVCVPLTNGETAARKVGSLEMRREILERAEKGQIVGVLVQLIDRKLVGKAALLHSDCEFVGEDDPS